MARKAGIENLGSAKELAQKYANRDDCTWIIWFNRFTKTYDISDSYETKDYFWIKADNVYPRKPVQEHAIVLSDDERALVAAVLDPKEPGRDYFPGTEITKRSLLQKMLRR